MAELLIVAGALHIAVQQKQRGGDVLPVEEAVVGDEGRVRGVERRRLGVATVRK